MKTFQFILLLIMAVAVGGFLGSHQRSASRVNSEACRCYRAAVDSLYPDTAFARLPFHVQDGMRQLCGGQQ